MKQNVFSLVERIKKVDQYFGVELIDYEREGNGILFASGCGIGLGLMDVCAEFRWFCDVDNYRYNPNVDWESIATILCAGKPSLIGMAGWFTIDAPKTFNAFKKGVSKNIPFFMYVGGESVSLKEFIEKINSHVLLLK